MIHKKQHPLAGKTVRIKAGATHPQNPTFGGSEFWVEDWWDRLGSGPWKQCVGNFAAMLYSSRVPDNKLPLDDEVLYGKVGPFGHLVHASEIEEVPAE